MKTWLTARDLAGLPGMPGTERRTRERLLKLNVPSRAHRLGVSHHDVYRALHPVVGPKAAGKAARIRAVLGLPTAPFPRGQGLATWHASGRKE
jgi:hypothetical protein